MQTETINLDALRAPSRKIVFLGREYELGYIPSGAAIPMIESYNELLQKQTKAAGGMDLDSSLRYAEENAKEVVEDSIDFIARFCSFFYPDVTRDEISREASKEMVDQFFMEIISSIVRNSARGNTGESGGDSGDSKKNTTGPSQ
ncbi:hypothetical protein [Breznakiella homolactica]|uniref:Uncharacterized protein n=1 Tax=Breznakiella homolactica TaxID=2798577 RepID=A0A7T7XPN9_9SPIR|nr:hypothetical protein [Breznakiella homolactica]QQO10093.1 hypothetical protein JFL75_04020 [Breznakiella homolactica]